MQTILPLPKPGFESGASASSRKADVREQPRLRFATGQPVFRVGGERQIYRVESGAVCHFSEGTDGRFAVIEFAFPGT